MRNMPLTPRPRTRRVKCDETQPCCKRCALSNRECLWVTPRHRGISSLSPALPRLGTDVTQQPTLSVNPSQIPRRDHEVQLFHYFRAEVAPQLTGMFDHEFWTNNLLRNTQLQPILWYACNAIAATHLLGRTGCGETQSHQNPDALPLQPYYQYQAALQSMRDLIALPFVTDTTKIDMIVASQLFIMLATLRGDNMEMMTHYKNTCMLVGLWKTWAQTRIHRRLDKHSIQAADSVVYTCFRADSLFLFMQPPSYKYHSYWEGCTLRLRDDPFVSLTEAYFELEPIWNNIVKVAVHPGPEGPEFVKEGHEFIQHICEHYKERLLKWDRKLADLRLRCREVEDRPALAVLDLRAATIKVLLYTCTLEVSSLCWDTRAAAFEKLLDDAKLLIELRYASAEQKEAASATAAVGGTLGLTSRAMTLSPMTNETLYLVARLCRDPAIRRRACALLAHDYHLAPSMHTLLYMHLADAQICLEENEWQIEAAVRESTSSCACSRERRFVCDGHRIYQTALGEMATTGAVLHLRTVDDYIHNRHWRTFPIRFNLHEKSVDTLTHL
ncbi:C6 zinc finger domain protein [Akanthomyces lecanii RCEF 1005]|uniref:C6 zinc finger domain protein n=1 Tax=Akanthomyces lecanii RCEF 1005 TaxID=1081108 RepID=A0A168I4C8_CORDF|nr:C6 zinc finger domain protein [Akanthomyces lecanii RCEF 1005]